MDESIELPHVPPSPVLPEPPEIKFKRPTFGKPDIPPGIVSGTARTSRLTSAPGETRDVDGVPTRYVTNRPRQDNGLNAEAVGRAGAGLSSGLVFAACIMAGYWIGDTIDGRWTQVKPYGELVFTLLGTAAGFLNLFRLLSIHDRKKKPK